MSSISKHNKICKEQKLPLVGTVYRPFKRKRQEKQLPYYHELIAFVNKHEYITNKQFFDYLLKQPLESPIHLDVSTHRKKMNAYAKIINLTVACRLAGLIPLDSIINDD